MMTDQEIEVYAIQTAALWQDGLPSQCLVKLIGDLPYEDVSRVLQRSVEISRELYEVALDEYERWRRVTGLR
jgi:hypothetical protein